MGNWDWVWDPVRDVIERPIVDEIDLNGWDNAECSGLAVGSTSVSFRPGTVTPSDYHFAVGTAGSTGLVLQTVMAPLMLANAPSRLVIEDGTHALAASPFDFIERTLLPVINRMGPTITAKLVRHGFFPRGGGRIEIDIKPAPLRALECIECGNAGPVQATAIVAGKRCEHCRRCLRPSRCSEALSFNFYMRRPDPCISEARRVGRQSVRSAKIIPGQFFANREA